MEKSTFYLGKRINLARKDRGLTAEKLSELCSINATYLRQIEGGAKIPSLPVFIDLCNALEVSPAYLLQDSVKGHCPGDPKAVGELLDAATPTQQEMITAMLQAALDVAKKAAKGFDEQEHLDHHTSEF